MGKHTVGDGSTVDVVANHPIVAVEGDADDGAIVVEAFAAKFAIVSTLIESIQNGSRLEHEGGHQAGEVNGILGKGCLPCLFFLLFSLELALLLGLLLQ